jgi:hypothetical protein
LTEAQTVRPISHQYHAGTRAGWPSTLGLAAILVLTATAWWRLRAGPIAVDGDHTRSPAPAAAARLHLKVRADGSITVGGEDTEVGLDALPARLTGPEAADGVEVVVHPEAGGTMVDRLLIRLRDAGVSRCAMVIDRPDAKASPPSTARADAKGGGTAP